MNQEEYFQKLEGIAVNHMEIGHQINVPGECHFARVIIDDTTKDPFGRINLTEVFNKMRSSFQSPVLIAVAYEADVMDEKGNNRQKRKWLMFYLLAKAKNTVKDLSDAISVINRMEAIADQILGFINEEHQLGYQHGHLAGKMNLQFDELSIKPIGPVKDNFCGVKVEVPWLEPAESSFKYDPSKFLTPIPETWQ